MPCYHPLHGWRSKTPGESGKRPVVFQYSNGIPSMPVTLPCGQCIGCRLERSRQWAVRCMHEQSLYDQNCFITLTFDNAHLDKDLSLRKEDFQKFIKRLRKRIPQRKIRYFHCGEYGEQFQRPHHHAILFNHNFPNQKLLSQKQGVNLYTSENLNELWPFGMCSIGAVTFESCAYVARYITKKITGPDSEAFYGDRIPPYNTMSRKPGIGFEWYKRFKTDVYPSDEVVVRRDVICKPPKFYDGKYELTNPDQFAKTKRRRLKAICESREDKTPDRLAVLEAVKSAQCKNLNRGLG